MNILIVDDNANNRMLLKLLINDFVEENKLTFSIDECKNGLEALSKANTKKYNLIFMDIMMPEMDGIEATKKIREIDREVMIIAVSAVDDDAKQKEILRNGAEDYVPKPIDAEQLSSRLQSYVSLLNLRQKEVHFSNQKSVNLYTNKIFHRQTIFYVENEEALSEFWEYYLLGDEPLKVDGLSDVVRAVFSLGDAIVKLSQKPWIIVEADNENIYFTLNKIDVIGSLVFKLLMKKNKEVTVYKHNEEKVSFTLEKRVSHIEHSIVKTEEVTSIQKEEKVVISPAVDTINVELQKTNVEDYEVYNYMDTDDLDEIEELLGDLSSIMLILGSSELKTGEISQMINSLGSLGKRLRVYTESYTIGQALSELSQDISLNTDRFHDIANDLSTMSSAFVSDLQSWFQLTFYKGAPSVDFMDATIVANVQTISLMLKEDNTPIDENDMDDIFDF